MNPLPLAPFPSPPLAFPRKLFFASKLLQVPSGPAGKTEREAPRYPAQILLSLSLALCTAATFSLLCIFHLRISPISLPICFGLQCILNFILLFSLPLLGLLGFPRSAAPRHKMKIIFRDLLRPLLRCCFGLPLHSE